MTYAGDVSCCECWEVLKTERHALLFDVRTNVEWIFVGIPDLSQINKEVILVDWQQFPNMTVNPSFTERVNEQVKANIGSEQAKLYFLCRSGVRSIAAAEALTAHGHEGAFNVLHGFEGNPDQNGQRGNLQGWKHDGLPWRQQ